MARQIQTCGIVFLALSTMHVAALAQGTGRGAVDKTQKLSPKEQRQERSRELFADAANAQNNGAYGVAIDQWKKLIADYPDSALFSSANHFLGVCYQEQDPPDFQSAIDSFRNALKDPDLKQTEDALVNLGWCLYQRGISKEPIDLDLIAEAARNFGTFLEKFPDSTLADKAMFYAGESEAKLEKNDRAILMFNQLVSNRNLAKSPLRPDALFSLGLTYEEVQQPKLAAENYNMLLSDFPKHPLVLDVTIRLGEIALQSDQAGKAIELFAKVIASSEFKKLTIADYILYRYAFALAKAGEFAKSADAYQALAKQFPQSAYAANASLAIGQTLLRDKKYDEAARSFERLLAGEDERALEASHWICQIAILQNRPADAVPVARRALAMAAKWNLKTLSPSAKTMMALVRMDLADGLYATSEGKSEARNLYERIAIEALDLPISPRATYNAAFAALQAGDHAEAQRWSEAFAKRFPNDELALDVAYIRAESLLQLSQFESSATAFEQLIRSAGDHPSLAAWELRSATAKYLGGEFESAIEVANKTLRRKIESETRAEALYLQGASQLKLKNYTDAIVSFTKSSQANAAWPQADETLLLLGQAYDANGDKQQAKTTLQRLLKEFPKSRFRQQAEFRLGQLSALEQSYDEALSWYDRVLAQPVDPALVDFVRYDKAYVLIQTNRFQQALELLDLVLSSNKNAALINECKTAKAICLRRTDRPAEAARLLEAALPNLAADQNNAKILYELGLSYSANKDYPKAIRTLERVAKEYPDYQLIDRCFFELAWAYKSMGDVPQANAWFQRITERFPDSPLAAESYFHVGQAEFENSKFDSAVKAYTVAAKKTSSAELQEKSLYKLGLALFQQNQFAAAADQFAKQLKAFPGGSLHVDARLMLAECSLKLERFSVAWTQYEQARKALENQVQPGEISDQVRAMIYVHGAQTARELKRWNDVDAWIQRMQEVVPGSNLEAIGKYEQAFAKQNLKRNDEAIVLYEEVAESQRNELGARSRFMIGEIYFADRNFAKAVSEFQKVMYGYGGTQAPDEVKNWQARSAYEAGRCTEVFIADLSGERRRKAVDTASKFYDFILSNHPDHELAKQAGDRVAELKK